MWRYCEGLFLLIIVLESSYAEHEHVHLKIHIPEIHTKHTHTKTKYIHLFHPKKPHHHHHVKFVHSRQDPLFKYHVDPVPLAPVHLPVPVPAPVPIEYPTLPDYETFRQLSVINTYGDPIPPGLLNDDHHRVPGSHQQSGIQFQPGNRFQPADLDDYDDDDDDDDDSDNDKYIPEPPPKKKHRKPKKMENNKKRETSHEFSRNTRKQKKFKPSPPADQHYNPHILSEGKGNFGFVKPTNDETTFSLQASNLNNQYFNVNPSAVDPSYYTTLPDEQEMEQMTGMEDDLYSGLLTNKFPKQVNERTKMIKNINSNRSKKHLTNLRNF